MDNENKVKDEYPSEITFKSIFRNKSSTCGLLKNILAEHELDGSLYYKSSKNGKFTSYTITVEFRSKNELESVCSRISTLDGFMTML